MTRPILTHTLATLCDVAAKKPPKYGNRKVTLDGVEFASQREARRYSELLILQRAGEIHSLEAHPKYVLSVNGQKIGTYTADARYRRGDSLVVEDVKGGPTDTQLFRWKARHLLAEHGVRVEIVR